MSTPLPDNAIARLMKPRSVAVIGASADPTKTAGRPVAYLTKHGFGGAIYPVNPRADVIGGLKSYPDVQSLPEAPDVGIVLLGAERAHEAVRELAARGTAAAIVLASGYTEVGAEGARRQQQLLEAAGSMRILGPNTIGLVNLTDRITLSATGALELEDFTAGSIGVVSQSGGILGALLSRAAARGIGLSKLISTSNEADLDMADFIDHLADDEATSVIALYMEGVRNPAKFKAAALKAARKGKPVVVFKVGRSESGAAAAVSHTGALAGADRMYDALFREVGVIRAQRSPTCSTCPPRWSPAGAWRAAASRCSHRPAARARWWPTASAPRASRPRRPTRPRPPRCGRCSRATTRCSTATPSTSRWRACSLPAARRDHLAAGEPELRRGGGDRRLLGPGHARPDGQRHPRQPPGQRQAAGGVREPACARHREPAEPARRARLHGARKLHERARGDARDNAVERARGAGRRCNGPRPHRRPARRAVERSRGEEPVRALRRALRARAHRRQCRRSGGGGDANWAQARWCSRSCRRRSRTRATWAAWPSVSRRTASANGSSAWPPR
jgi:succinyl-CoA synthetase alpha subunit